MLFVDREDNRGANLFLCETEDDLRRIDAALDETTPRPDAAAAPQWRRTRYFSTRTSAASFPAKRAVAVETSFRHFPAHLDGAGTVLAQRGDEERRHGS